MKIEEILKLKELVRQDKIKVEVPKSHHYMLNYKTRHRGPYFTYNSVGFSTKEKREKFYYSIKADKKREVTSVWEMVI